MFEVGNANNLYDDRIVTGINNLIGLNFGTGSKIGIGLYSYEDLQNTRQCYVYSQAALDHFLDPPFKAARAFAVMANLCTGVTMICLICLSCMSFTKLVMKMVGCLSLLGGLFQCFTLLIFASEICTKGGGCTFYIGAGLSIAAALLAMINGCFIFSLKQPKARNTSNE